MPTSKYDAFISYSHAADSQLAEALEASLQRFAKPIFKLRGMRVFRDQSDLSLAPHLWGDIETALSASKYFLLLASPEAAASPWVTKELEHWIATHGAETVLIIQTDGQIQWDEAAGEFDWEKTTSLPRVLKGAFAGEPLYLDMSWASAGQDLSLGNDRFTRAVAQIVAAIQERPVEDIYGDELRRHKKTIRLRNGAIALLTILTGASLVAAMVAVNQSRVATAQRNRANRAAQAERVARQATEQQLDFITEVLNDQFEMRDQVGEGPRSLVALRLFFGHDQDEMPANALPLLARLAAFLRANPSAKVLIAGHSAEFDPSGAELGGEYALALSQRRAQGVREYLLSRGVAAQQLSTLARGKSQALIQATNPEERVNAIVRQMNSRAELYLDFS